MHAVDGLDEISLASPTHVAELRNGQITEYSIQPEDFGIDSQSLIGLSVDGPQESLELIQAALGKSREPRAQKARDLITLNAGAAIYAADIADTLAEGIARAQDAIGSGLALEKIGELVSFTACFDTP